MTPTPPSLVVRRFAADDFPTYRAWYADALLNQHLGPMDDEWLAHVLADTEGEQWAVLSNGALVTVIGLTPDATNSAWVITDLAVDPARRGQGWGRRALHAVLAQPALRTRHHWRAYVAQDNPQAQAFFDALGWRRMRAPVRTIRSGPSPGPGRGSTTQNLATVSMRRPSTDSTHRARSNYRVGTSKSGIRTAMSAWCGIGGRARSAARAARPTAWRPRTLRHERNAWRGFWRYHALVQAMHPVARMQVRCRLVSHRSSSMLVRQ